MKKLLTFLLSSLLLFGSLAGCTTEDDGTTDGATVGSDQMILMNGFEDFSSQIQCIRLVNGFGQVNVNRDAQYVKSGKQSIQLRPNGWNYTTARPLISVPTFSIKYNYGYGDFSAVKKVLVSAYNAEETPLRMGICLSPQETGTFGEEEQKRTPCEYYDLQPGWNELEYAVIPAYLTGEPLASFDIKQVYGVCFEFEHIGSRNIEDAPTVYLDDIYLVKHDKNATAAEKQGTVLPLKADAEAGVWELCDFEDPMQVNFFSFTGGYTIQPTLEVVSSVDCGIASPSGMNMLKFTQRNGLGSAGNSITRISRTPIQMALNAIGQDIIDNPQNYVYKMDVYNDANVKAKIALFSMVRQDGVMSSKYLPQTYQPKTWTTFSVNFKDIEDSFKDGGSFLASPDYIRILYAHYYTEADIADRDLYIDNIRIEKVVTEG